MEINLLTALFLVFAGMLVGYFLFYRDRRSDESVRQKLMRDNDELRNSMNVAHASYDSLDEKHSRQRGQLNVLQQLCDDWSNSREQAERERAQLEHEVGARKKRLDEVDAEYREEKRLRIEAEDKLHKQTQNELKKVSSLEDSWKKKHSKSESCVIRLESELKAALLAGSEVKEASQKYKELDKQYALLQQEANTLRNKITDLEAFEPQCESLKQSLTNAEQQLAKVNEQRDAAIAAEKSAAAISSGLQKRLDNQESTIHMLRQNQDDALENLKHELTARSQMESKLDSRVKELRDQFATQRGDYEKQIETLRQQLGQQTNAHTENSKELKAEVESQRTSYEKQIETLRQQLGQQTNAHTESSKELKAEAESQRTSYEAQINTLREQLEKQAGQYAEHSKDLRAQLDLRKSELNEEKNRWSSESETLTLRYREKQTGLRGELETLKMQSQEYTQTIVKLDAQRDQLQSDLAEVRQQMQAQLRQDSESIGQLQRERNELREELSSLHQQLASLQEKVGGYEVESQQFASETQRFETETAEMATMQMRIEELEAELGRYNSKTKQLQAESAELARLRDDYTISTTRQQQLQMQIDELRAYQANLDDPTREEFEEKLQRLQLKLDASEETIRNLRRERAGVLARLANYRQIADPETTVISFTHAVEQKAKSEYEVEYGGKIRHDEVRGVVFTETPDSRDDLKRISGIAEVLEGRLNDFGIFSFKQIMEWKPAAIEEFSRLLAFRDRIERDDWQGQARFFYNQKTKRPANAAAAA